MNPFNRRLTASMAGVIFATSSIWSIGAHATQAGSVDTNFFGQEYGIATLVSGVVTKSQPTDETKSSYGEFVPLKVSEKLLEGTLVKTGIGNAEIRMMNDGKVAGITRLYKNTLATISGKTRLVYLYKGELIHNKERSDRDHVIETKLLQARIHGTTVTVQAIVSGDEEIDRVLVSETQSQYGVEVLNRTNGSKVILRPGITLEIRGKIKAETSEIQNSSERNNLCLNPNKGELLFRDGTSQTIAYVANSKAILEDPMVKGGNGFGPIDSVNLIRTDMAKVPSSDDLLSNFVDAAINLGKPDKLILKNLKIASVPRFSSYEIGPNVGTFAEGKPIELPVSAEMINKPQRRVADLWKFSATTAKVPTTMQVMPHLPIEGVPTKVDSVEINEALPNPVNAEELLQSHLSQSEEADKVQESVGKAN